MPVPWLVVRSLVEQRQNFCTTAAATAVATIPAAIVPRRARDVPAATTSPAETSDPVATIGQAVVIDPMARAACAQAATIRVKAPAARMVKVAYVPTTAEKAGAPMM